MEITFLLKDFFPINPLTTTPTSRVFYSQKDPKYSKTSHKIDWTRLKLAVSLIKGKCIDLTLIPVLILLSSWSLHSARSLINLSWQFSYPWWRMVVMFSQIFVRHNCCNAWNNFGVRRACYRTRCTGKTESHRIFAPLPRKTKNRRELLLPHSITYRVLTHHSRTLPDRPRVLAGLCAPICGWGIFDFPHPSSIAITCRGIQSHNCQRTASFFQRRATVET